MISKYTLEICANSLDSAINAQNGGAHRIELCDNLYEGGTTPSYGTILLTREKLHIDINILIRPRGGDFSYSDSEFEIMKKDIEFAKKSGVNGVVFGILLENGNVDKERIIELIQLARPMSVTFHRAFDVCSDPFVALEDIIACGCDRILTSGQHNKAIDAINLLSELIKKADNRIIIMPGSGINETNISKLFKKTKAKEYHASLRKTIDSKMSFRKESVNMNSLKNIPEYEISITDTERVKKTIEILNELTK